MIQAMTAVQRDYNSQLQANKTEFESDVQNLLDSQVKSLETSAKITGQVLEKRSQFMLYGREEILLDITNQSL